MFFEGQKVICINDGFPAWTQTTHENFPVKDEVYTIRAIMPGRGNTGGKVPKEKDGELVRGTYEVCVLLAEIRNPEFGPEGRKVEAGFNAERFSPLKELDEEQIEEATRELNAEVPVNA